MEIKELLIKIGQNIRHIRKLKNISVEDMASYESIGKNHIYEIEKGEYNITMETLIKISSALKVEPYQIMLFGKSKESIKKIHEIFNKINLNDIDELNYFMSFLENFEKYKKSIMQNKKHL